MAITLIQIKRWYNMLLGKSVEHVNQGIGEFFDRTVVSGYYNNLTQKVLLMPDLLESDKFPEIEQLDGQVIQFPVATFQYALGCYDLFIATKESKYLRKFLQCAEWTLNNQDSKGRWDNFSHTYPQAPYGAMAQGEAASVLIRAYQQTNNMTYLTAAQKALDFMLTPVKDGGTSIYEQGELLFAEYTHLPIVLNGWIFAWWGLYDYVLATDDNSKYKESLIQSCKSIIKYLPKFKNIFWSKYDLGNMITSPFYHKLHIAQMQAMYNLTDEFIFAEYASLWNKQLNNPFNKCLAFIIKAVQKISEKQ